MKNKGLFLIILLFVLFPLKVFAEGIENYFINATVLNNGDLEVEEYFNLTGSYNGMERIIDFRNTNAFPFNPDTESYGGSDLHNGDAVEIYEIRAVNINESFSFKDVDGLVFEEVGYASKGDYGVYTESSTYDGKSVLIYLPSSKNKAFYIKYTIKNMAILHNDIAELGWNAIGSHLSESIENLVITVNIPGNNNEIRVWGHGPLLGYSEIVSKNEVKASIKDLNSYTAIDVRVVFDKEVIPLSKKRTNINALDKIILYETDEAAKANYEREQNDLQNIYYIENLFDRLETIPSFSTYSEIKGYIDLLNDGEIKNEYLDKLSLYKDKVDNYEYDLFKDYLNKKDLKYEDYKNASDKLSCVFSKKLKKQMEKELAFAKKIIIKNEEKRENKYATISICTLLLGIIIFSINKYSYRMIKNVDPKYYRDFPSDISPAEAGLLVNKTLNKNEISASVLEMIRKKIISYEKKDNNSFDLILDQKITLNEEERKIRNLIFDNKSRVNSKKIKKIPYYKYDNFRKAVTTNMKNEHLINKYDDKKNYSGLLITSIIMLFTPLFPIGLILLLIYMILKHRAKILMWIALPISAVLILLSLVFNHFNHYSMVICIITFVVIKILLKRLPVKLDIDITSEGKEIRNKWYAFKNFLLSFSRMDEKEIPEVNLWEKYLVYAVSLGIGKEVLNSMKIKLETDMVDTRMMDTMILFNDINSLNNIMSVTNHIGSVGAQPFQTSSLSSGWSSSSGGGSFSSGSGGGGGFSGGSSGGGSFGGGGGGGRF